MTWLLTWTTYGTWLPGDVRGFVSRVPMESGDAVTHNEPGTRYDADVPALRRYAESIMKQPPVWLTAAQASQVADQFRETATFSGWLLLALAVMTNHVHLVVEATEDILAEKLLTDFKAYATRRLDREFGGKENRRSWTERGSTRPLRDPGAVAAAVEYVNNQDRPLVVWTANSEP